MIALLIVIFGIILLIQTRKNQQKIQATGSVVDTVPLNDVLPSKSSAPAEGAVSSPAAASSGSSQETASASAVSDKPAEEQVPAGKAVQSPSVPEAVSEEVRKLIDQAIAVRQEGNIIAARDLLNDALNHPLSEAVREEVKKQLSTLSEQWLFSPDVLAGDTLTELYRVKPGDLLANLADAYKVPYPVLQELNRISRPEMLQAGQTLKMIHGPFNAVVHRSNFTMDLYLQDKYVKSYRVGLGLEERETPTGLWRAAEGGKLIKPTWTDPDTKRTYVADDPDYPLGSRWIGLEGLEGNAKGRTGFALHGTKDPETIGTRSSRGCVRLFNGDIIEVYNLLYSGHSLVRVVDE